MISQESGEDSRIESYKKCITNRTWYNDEALELSIKSGKENSFVKTEIELGRYSCQKKDGRR